MQSLRIYIVEDEERSRRGLADLITSLMPQALMVGQALMAGKLYTTFNVCARTWYLPISGCR